MTTALGLVTGALRKIGQYAAGEPLDPVDLADALDQLNALLDAWSTEHLSVYNNVENTFILTPGKVSYTVGNPTLGNLLGTTSTGSAVITGVLVPSDLIAGANLIGAGLPIGTKVVSFSVGANTVTMDMVATSAFVLQPIAYTGPGDFPIERPLRITNCYTRLTTSGISQVDYQCTEAAVDQYTQIGLKSQPGPWPKIFYYDTSFPLSKLFLWPVPQQAGEFHMWSDQLFTLVNATDEVNLPQGYNLALQCALALLLAPEYGVQPNPLLIQQAASLKTQLKRLNGAPQAIASYDNAIVGRPQVDAGWYLSGGFTS